MRDGRIRLLAVPPRAEDLPLFFQHEVAGWLAISRLSGEKRAKGRRRACDVRREGKKTTSSVNDEKATTGLMAQRLDTTRKRGEENQKGQQKMQQKEDWRKKKKGRHRAGALFSTFPKDISTPRISPLLRIGGIILLLSTFFSLGYFFKILFCVLTMLQSHEKNYSSRNSGSEYLGWQAINIAPIGNAITSRTDSISHTQNALYTTNKRMT